MSALYRVRQFWSALFASPKEADLDLARQTLSDKQMALFARMQPGEQAHSLKVFKKLHVLSRQGSALAGIAESQVRELFVAALLHDVGKTVAPLRLWERVLIVLVNAVWPEKVREWGTGFAPKGWRRPFVIAVQHPAWGVELAETAGTSSLALNLIRRHQDPLPELSRSPVLSAEGAPELGRVFSWETAHQISDGEVFTSVGTIEDRLLRVLQSVDGDS